MYGDLFDWAESQKKEWTYEETIDFIHELLSLCIHCIVLHNCLDSSLPLCQASPQSLLDKIKSNKAHVYICNKELVVIIPEVGQYRIQKPHQVQQEQLQPQVQLQQQLQLQPQVQLQAQLQAQLQVQLQVQQLQLQQEQLKQEQLQQAQLKQEQLQLQEQLEQLKQEQLEQLKQEQLEQLKQEQLQEEQQEQQEQQEPIEIEEPVICEPKDNSDSDEEIELVKVCDNYVIKNTLVVIDMNNYKVIGHLVDNKLIKEQNNEVIEICRQFHLSFS